MKRVIVSLLAVCICNVSMANYPSIGLTNCTQGIPEELKEIEINYDNQYSEQNFFVPEILTNSSDLVSVTATSYDLVPGFPHSMDVINNVAIFKLEKNKERYDFYFMVRREQFIVLDGGVPVDVALIKKGASFVEDDDTGYPMDVGPDVFRCKTIRLN